MQRTFVILKMAICKKNLSIFTVDFPCDSPVLLKSEATFQFDIVVQEGHQQLILT